MPAPKDPTTAYARSVVARRTVTNRLVRLACQRHLDDMKQQKKKRLCWELELAKHAIAFFRENLRLADGRPFVLEPFQEFIVGSVFGWLNAAGYRRFRNAYIESGKGSGKALWIDTPIATPEGWATMGTLSVGDRVFDGDGVPTRVLRISAVMDDRHCYELVFDDGERIIADAEHFWFTEQRTYSTERGASLRDVPRGARGGWRRKLRTTLEICETRTYKNGEYQSANHSVPLAKPLELMDVVLPVEPYVLGFWLGDGDSDAARVTIADADAEVLGFVAEAGVRVGPRKRGGSTSGTTGRYRLGGGYRQGVPGRETLNAKLRALGVLGNKSVPPAYLRASFRQRLSLLQGLMDSDGYIDEMGQCEFTSTNEHLAEAVVELLHSVGIKAKANPGRAKVYGRDVGPKWRVSFHPPDEVAVFRLGRKRARQYKRHSRRRLSGERRIVDVRPVESVPVRCIQVEADSGMFLCGRGMIPTHNSPLAAGVGLYGLVCDSQDDPQAEIYSAAVTREQAGIVFKDASNMSETSPELAEIVEVNAASLIMGATRSVFRPVSSEHRGLDGKRVHMALIDEIHEHPHALVVDKMRAGTKARRNALIFEITNSGWDRTSVCWDHHDYSVKLLEGTEKNDAWFAYVCGLDDGDDWKNEKVWPKANPGLGTVLPIEYLREQVTEAKGMPSKENICRRLNFCEWTEQSIIWLPIKDWEKCRAPRPVSSLRGAPCFAGIDLASTSDFTALVLAFPDGDDLDVVRHFWLPENARHAKRSERNRLLINEWARRGLVTLTPGEVTDYNFIQAEVVKAMRNHKIQAIGFDRWNSSQLISNLMADGAPMVEFGQGVASMSSPSKQLERLVRVGGIRHGDDPVLRWMAGNVCVTVDHAGNIKPDKASSGEKIDGIVALIMAIGCWMNHQDQDTDVIYNDASARPDGLLTL